MVSGRGLVLGADVPDRLATVDVDLQVGAGLGVVDVPLSAGGAKFRLSVDALGRTVVATLDGSQSVVVSNPGAAPDGGLNVQIVQHFPNGGTAGLGEARRVPIAAGPSGRVGALARHHHRHNPAARRVDRVVGAGQPAGTSLTRAACCSS